MNTKTMNNLFFTTSLLILSPSISKAESVYMCEPCPAGYSCNNGVKSPCPAGTFSNAVSTSCSKCPEGQYSTVGAGSCGSACLKNAYSILIASYKQSYVTGFTFPDCYTSFSSKTFSAGTKITDQIYEGNFTTSRGKYKTGNCRSLGCQNQGSGTPCYDCDCVYTGGTIYRSIKFHFNNNKEKIEVITNTGSVIAELEATMCE